MADTLRAMNCRYCGGPLDNHSAELLESCAALERSRQRDGVRELMRDAELQRLRSFLADRAPTRKEKPKTLSIHGSHDEIDYVRHAARLVMLSPEDYVKRAINRELRRNGVDAVLFRESGDDA